MKKEVMDGNTACSTVAYNFIEVAGIYPITPASTMAELVDKYSSEDRKNIFGKNVKVVEMQSEAGAIGMVHGSLQMGVLTSTFTASQGLLLMLPNMYKIAGECLPCVINVAARTVATHALSIMGDHSDIYSARQTGFCMMASSSVQDVMYLTAVSYLSAFEGSLPFLNFFDGFRTSHELDTVDVLEQEDIKKLVNYDKINEFRKRALDINNPVTRGTNQGDSIYFENVESRNKLYKEMPDIVNDYMKKINELKGTDYKPFNYYGHPKAKKIIIAMGSVCETIKETVDYLISKGEKVGLVEVHLYRPFSKEYLINVIPETTEKIAVLDRTKEPGSTGEPLYLDVVNALNDYEVEIIGGRYGLSSKNTTPGDIASVYSFLDKEYYNGFTIGIKDDLTHLSLEKEDIKLENKAKEILFYGYGSDGMVTAAKDILKIIGKSKDKYVQGYFEYDSKKSGGVTKSHLRFSDEVIRSTYYVNNPEILVCTKDSYLKKYKMLNSIKDNGIFILNTNKDLNEVLTKEDIEILKNKNIKLYTIDANLISINNNIPNKISMIMEIIILKISGLIDIKEAQELMEKQIRDNFTRKGEDVVNSNLNALKEALDSYKEIDVKELTSNLEKEKVEDTLFSKLEHLDTDNILVSDFIGKEDGTFSSGTSKKEKRNISSNAPCYDSSKCAMCNLCSFVCPHAVIRAFLLNKDEEDKAPEEVKEKLKDSKIDNYKYTIGISQLDCTSCGLCTKVCPTKAITMDKVNDKEVKRAEYLFNEVTEKEITPVETIKNSQFKHPKFEFSGACAGCGETPYIKLLTQLFGDNMIIANATGCSSIYGASLPSTPYTVPWVNSLFEDNAEFGLGMKVADLTMKNHIKEIMEENKDKLTEKNKKLVDEYLNNYSKEVSNKVYNELDYHNLPDLIPLKKYIQDKSVWIIGGDGWAYDIGFGGIDHVLASNYDVNILVLDTEVYSNTGGQSSKSTRKGAIAKFASSGKVTEKKDLAKIAMTYPNVYVATVSLGANYNQVIQAFKEAKEHNGPSIVIAYAPCIAHGIKTGMVDSIEEEKLATTSGYFPIFRYNPKDEKLTLDSKADFTKYEDIFKRETRYNKSDENLLKENKKYAEKTYKYYEELSKK